MHHVDLNDSVGGRSATWVIKILGVHWDETMSPFIFWHAQN